MRVGILFHPARPRSCALADKVERLLASDNVKTWRTTAYQDALLKQEASELDVLLTLGGDGTIVRAQHAAASAGLPVLGVNLGRLGFLAEVEPEDIEQALAKLVGGAYVVEERMMLHVEVWRDDDLLLQSEAINDVVVARGAVSRTVRVAARVDGHHMITSTGDGVIVSTPTGSTAYCLAAGGPIVAPDLPSLTMTPIAAHLGIAPAVVIPAERTLCLELVSGRGAIVTIDGQLDHDLQEGDSVCSSISAQVARFIRFQHNGHFYEMVLRKLGWPDPN